jgi:Glycosyl transferase family 11
MYSIPKVEFNTPGDTYQFYCEKTFAYDQGVWEVTNDKTVFAGNWQSEKYFVEPLVRDHFVLRNTPSDASVRVAMQIQMGPSCSIHVRRSDYTIPSKAAYPGLMEMEYYIAAIHYIEARTSKVRFFVFSDDPEWCRANFQRIPYSRSEFTIVDHNGFGNGSSGPGTQHEDLWMMRLATHAIISNSTFGWWGAWLNPDKERMVIAPKDWFNPTGDAKDLDTKDICPERWIRL